MIIKLLEPLGVPNALIEKLASPLEKAGHEFVYYKEKQQTRKSWQNVARLDIVMIATIHILGSQQAKI